MKILFRTRQLNAPSTLLNLSLLRGLQEINGVQFEYDTNCGYAGYDVILFMGYDAEIARARHDNSAALIGVIDPRPSFKEQPEQADFILANGIEMKDWYVKYCSNIFVYPIYPPLSIAPKAHEHAERLIIGYHGNAIHLAAMADRISPAIERLAENMDVELWVMYNMAALGRVEKGLPTANGARVRHIQWTESGYEQYMSQVDIGVVPNTIPIQRDNLVKVIGSTFRNRMNEHTSDYLLRFKATSNAGRAMVFAQCGIPIIMDMSPSSLQLICDEVDGYVCHSTDAWYQALLKLGRNPILRSEVGTKMLEKFSLQYAPQVLNRNLIKFIEIIRNS